MAVRSRLRESTLEVIIEGPFKFDQHIEFRNATAAISSASEIQCVAVNLFDVSYLDSSALGMLLAMRDEAQKAGITVFELIGARGSVKQVLDIARFDKFFKIA